MLALERDAGPERTASGRGEEGHERAGLRPTRPYLTAPAPLLIHLSRSPQQGLQVAPSPRKPISPDPMGKPPASPASREITSASDNECVFLVGAYQRYLRVSARACLRGAWARERVCSAARCLIPCGAGADTSPPLSGSAAAI